MSNNIQTNTRSEIDTSRLVVSNPADEFRESKKLVPFFVVPDFVSLSPVYPHAWEGMANEVWRGAVDGG